MNHENANAPSLELLREIRQSIAEIEQKIGAIPNVLVTTTAIKDELARLAGVSNPTGHEPSVVAITCFGIKVEDYATVKECLDRMMTPQPGEVLQMAYQGDIPSDCLDHPWIRKEFERYAFSSYEPDIRFTPDELDSWVGESFRSYCRSKDVPIPN